MVRQRRRPDPCVRSLPADLETGRAYGTRRGTQPIARHLARGIAAACGEGGEGSPGCEAGTRGTGDAEGVRGSHFASFVSASGVAMAVACTLRSWRSTRIVLRRAAISGWRALAAVA